MSTPNTIFDRVRQPEYVGENRCLPCTLLNSLIALAVSVGVALLWLPAGLLVFVVSVAAIYFRGYLVPGTPELTKRYFPAWVLSLFGKDPFEDLHASEEGVHAAAVTAEENDESAPEETEELLLSAGVVRECEDDDDLCLTERFAETWWRRIYRFREDEERAANQLAAAVDVDPTVLEFTREDDYFGVTYEGDLIARWSSDAAFYADLAAEPTLAEWVPEWPELGDRRRTELLAGMRAFLEECPACDADLEQVEDVRKSCCMGEMVSVSVTCEECGAEVFSGSYT